MLAITPHPRRPVARAVFRPRTAAGAVKLGAIIGGILATAALVVVGHLPSAVADPVPLGPAIPALPVADR